MKAGGAYESAMYLLAAPFVLATAAPHHYTPSMHAVTHYSGPVCCLTALLMRQ